MYGKKCISRSSFENFIVYILLAIKKPPDVSARFYDDWILPIYFLTLLQQPTCFSSSNALRLANNIPQLKYSIDNHKANTATECVTDLG